ncbi:MAG: hypothetical protein ABTQ73_10860 [Caldilineales bacterium]
MMSVRSALVNTFLSRPFNGLSAEQIAQQLELSGRTLERTFAAAKDSPHNCALLSHIIGIERWGQSRLRVALGAPLLRDEYDGYRPPREANWLTLQTAFTTTRSETVALTRQLATALMQDVKVAHNQFGPLHLRVWLRYLNLHANLEAKKLR